MPDITLSIVVLAWNNVKLTRECVRTLREGTDVPFELIIVDNGSEPEAAGFASEAADIAIMNDRNLGFAAGMNQGLAAAKGDVVAFVNNDTRFPENWASGMVDIARRRGTGIVLPVVTKAGMTVSQRETPGDEVIMIPPFTDMPSAVVYLMRREMALSLGGWNETYRVASAEDFDLLFTVWANDLDVILDERILVDHVGSATASSQLTDHHDRWVANRRQFLERWKHASSSTVVRIDSCDPAVFERNLSSARLAAIWIDRWFEKADALGEERQKVRALRNALAPPPPTHVSRLRKIVRSLVPVRR